MKVEDQYVAVIGGKRSGQAAAAMLRARGAHVRILDATPESPEVLPQTAESLAPPLDLVVLSPGVPRDLSLLSGVRVPVLGEVELASFFLRGPVIGITGSNGKTTTTALVGHILKHCGIPHQVGGNIGTAVTAMVETSREEQWNVLELSSFQLEDIRNFRAQIAVCLNVTPDHLDRHKTFENYTAAKGRLFVTQTAEDFAILNGEDPVCSRYPGAARRVLFFPGEGVGFMEREAIPLRGQHNIENVLAAAHAVHLAGASWDGIAAAIRTFPGVEHRIEFVRQLRGVDYYNDSKATNVDATLKAIAAFDGPLWIILGGKDKGSDYGPLRAALQQKARGILTIGAAAGLIESALEGLPLVPCGDLARAVRYAHAYAATGDTVLLAPACASFDQFSNYEERGKCFKQFVGDLS